jgi:tRNA modification GTPase
VEQIGVERSRHAMRSADVLLLVLDRSRPLSRGDELALQAIDDGRRDEDQNRSPRLVVTLNKSDLPPRLTVDGLADRLQPVALVESNTIELDGMEAVRDALALAALGGARQEHVAGNARHGDALRRAGDALRAAMDGYDHGTPLDLIALDVRAAAAALGEIGGANVDDELLDRIFREFCIGK